MTRGQRAYREFLKTDFWKDMSAMKRRIVKRCERCPTTKTLQCHHRIYRDSWYDTRMEDLEVVCKKCHQEEHGLRDPEQEQFEAIFWACEDIHEMIQKTLWRYKLLTKSQKKRLRHIAEMFSDNGGVLYRYRNAMDFHWGMERALKMGLRGEAAHLFAFNKPKPND